MLAGVFASAARLSPKALRLYAEQGLLLPARVDPATGYRYYAPDQLPRARLIARLRGLGLPLARIGSLADLTAEARALELRGWLRAQRERLDEWAVMVEDAQGSIDDQLSDAVGLRGVPAAKVLCRSRRIDSTVMAGFVRTAERDIRAHLRASGLPSDGTKLVSFYDSGDARQRGPGRGGDHLSGDSRARRRSAHPARARAHRGLPAGAAGVRGPPADPAGV